MNIAVTGATGFLGSALLERFSSQNEVIALVRKEPLDRLAGVQYRICGDLSPLQGKRTKQPVIPPRTITR